MTVCTNVQPPTHFFYFSKKDVEILYFCVTWKITFAKFRQKVVKAFKVVICRKKLPNISIGMYLETHVGVTTTPLVLGVQTRNFLTANSVCCPSLFFPLFLSYMSFKWFPTAQWRVPQAKSAHFLCQRSEIVTNFDFFVAYFLCQRAEIVANLDFFSTFLKKR